MDVSDSNGDGAQVGSWADEMAYEYQRAATPEIKSALEDGKVSDREYAEMKQRYSECLSAVGIVLTSYGFEGGSFTPPSSMSNDQAHAAESKCSEQSGEYPIGYFYVQMRANPSHKDMGQAIVNCFKRHGLVGDGYGLKDYRAGDLPGGSDNPTVNSCSIDPDELLGG